MDLQKEFRDLNANELPDNLPTEDKPVMPLPENPDDHDEGQQIIKDLQDRLAKLKEGEPQTQTEDIHDDLEDHNEILEDDGQQFENDDPSQNSLLERIQPFIIPICLTIFAIIFAAIFLYFFSKSNVQQSAGAITNVGDVPQIVTTQPTPVVTVQPLVCTDPQILNSTGDACVDPSVVATSTPVVETLPAFENGTTTIVNVRFSFDKYNYDNYPRGIYLLQDQIFDGDYSDFKILPTNRAFANDHFFGVNRNMVSLMGDCQYVVDEAKILVKDMNDSTDDQVYSVIKDRYFRGNVVKVLEASKPHIVCNQ